FHTLALPVPPAESVRTSDYLLSPLLQSACCPRPSRESNETMPGIDSSAAKRARLPQRGPQLPRFIVIEGPLRVGKTTLARVLAERLHARRIYDCDDNPFLADFYNAKPGSALR